MHQYKQPLYVAPFAGAWIEIADKEPKETGKGVAPFAGAWIEIIGVNSKFYGNYVAPFAGAWIEIIWCVGYCICKTSLPSRERGLKYFLRLYNP